MAKGSSVSGFPEWLPEERAVEMHAIDKLREVFELNGFIGIETRVVETGASLLKKGETSKEIYLLSRLQEVGHESDTPIENRLGLHFDLTVPLSRYVVEHSGALVFPFKRWQIQKVWRGERPQDGRFREFYQADIDVVGSEKLAEHYEIDVPLVMLRALDALKEFGLPAVQMHINNRKLSEGFYRCIGLTDVDAVLHQIDKLDKMSAGDVKQLLIDESGATEQQAQACLELAQITTADSAELDAQFARICSKFGVDEASDDYAFALSGLETLKHIIRVADEAIPGSVVADLRIARGLDYYTGSVYETFLDGVPELGSICSGGRYDNLVSSGNRTYPGVGMSIGLSRLLSYLFGKVGVSADRQSPSSVLVAVWDEDQRDESNRIAQTLRGRGISADVSPDSDKLGKQIKYASKLGIPYVWFPADNNDGSNAESGEVAGDQVKNIITGEQTPADRGSWLPDNVYEHQMISTAKHTEDHTEKKVK
jgi:histidyl-tRNA synthetase